MSKEIERYNVEQANKLLQNIQELSDLRMLKVMKPDSTKMEQCNLFEWKKWLENRIATRGAYGVEREFINIIYTIDNQLMITCKRAEEGFRRLLDNLELLEERNKELEEENKELKDKYKEIYDEKMKLLMEIYDLNKEKPTIVENPVIVPEIEPKKKLNPYQQVKNAFPNINKEG